MCPLKRCGCVPTKGCGCVPTQEVWGDWWLVCATLPFGWKKSPFVYQTIGLAATNYFRSVGIACSLYIDDRLNGEIFTNEGYWSKLVGERDAVFSKQSADAVLYIVSRLLIQLEYFLGLKKCVLMPVNCITCLGMEVKVHQTPKIFFPLNKFCYHLEHFFAKIFGFG